MLIQSNIIKNDFVTTINRLYIDVIQRKLEKIFSPENFDPNDTLSYVSKLKVLIINFELHIIQLNNI
jgi:hypothetical protein